jgi:hypothetical protein
VVDEIAVLHEFSNEEIDLPQGQLRTSFEIATNEAVLMHAHFEGRRASIFDGGGTELLG